MFNLSCSSDNPTDPDDSSEGKWLIPQKEIKDGGPGKDGIPAIINPNLVPVSSIDYLRDNDLVIGIKFGDDVRVYPHVIIEPTITVLFFQYPMMIVVCHERKEFTASLSTKQSRFTGFQVSLEMTFM